MKKFLFLCLTAMLPVIAWAYGTTIDGLNYNFDDSNNTCTLTYTSNSGSVSTYSGDIVVPETVTYEGVQYTVTAVDDYCFYRGTGITSVVLPNTITYIGTSAFYRCTALKEIVIPDAVTTLGMYAFEYCEALEKAVVGKGITTIDQEAFCFCYALSDVTLGENVSVIGKWSFYQCYALEHLTFPESLTEIVWGAFMYCNTLKEVILPDKLTTIGEYAFEYCEGLEKVVIGNGCTDIGQEAFCFCYGLKEVTFGENVATIGKWSFYQCDEALESIVFPQSVTSIGYGSFEYCYKLKNVTIENANTYIDQEAFCYCRELESVDFGENLSTIGQYAFYECLALTDLYIPESVTSVDYGAFEYCISLKNLTIGNGCTSIGQEAFCYCYDLETVSLGESVSSIATSAFLTSAKLSSFTVLNTTPPSCSTSVFYEDVPSSCVLYVPASAVSDYSTASTWEDFIVRAIQPTVATYEATDITDSEATLNGSVAAINCEDIIERGFKYWCDDNEEQIIKVDTTTDGDITANVDELHYGTQYTFCTYATTASDVTYGEELTFTTAINAPTVETLDATTVKATYAVLNARVELGSEEPTRTGFLCWSAGSNEVTTIIVNELDGEQMSSVIGDLTPEVTYTYCAFVTTELLGTTYGDEISFTTLDIASGIANVETDTTNGEKVVGIYSIDGQQLNSMQKGINIVRYADGTTKKVLVK